MLVYRNYKTFVVLGSEINLMTEMINSSQNTVAEINNQIYYMGAELDNISTAVFAWQEANGRELTSQELRQTMLGNNVLQGNENEK